MRDLLYVALAGAGGSLARYGVGVAAARWIGTRFAWGTLAVNVIGCFLLACFLTVALATESIPRATKLAISTGFLGAFTTFSTFGYETMTFMERGEPKLAAWNVIANLVLGLAAAWLGLALGRQFIS